MTGSSLEALIQNVYAAGYSTEEERMAQQERLQGSTFQPDYDANHPLQSWAKFVSDTVFGESTVSASQTPQNTKTKWDTWVPVVLLAAALLLVLNEQ